MLAPNPGRAPPVPYNFTEEVPIKCNSFSNLDEHRTCTDVFCTIIGLLFSVIMIVFGLTLFDYGTASLSLDSYIKSNFPTDSDGKLCGVDVGGYNYVYFANAPNIVNIHSIQDRRVCVSSCPSPSDTKLNCYMTKTVGCKFSSTPGFDVKKYDVYTYDGGNTIIIQVVWATSASPRTRTCKINCWRTPILNSACYS